MMTEAKLCHSKVSMAAKAIFLDLSGSVLGTDLPDLPALSEVSAKTYADATPKITQKKSFKVRQQRKPTSYHS